jgi:hypothetical protein
MHAFISALTFLAAAIQYAHGAVYITDPVGTSSDTGGKSSTITWNDDGKQPTLAQIGLCNVGLYVGSADTQYLLQTITTNLDVSTASSLPFTPDPSVGANSNEYFIRFTALNFNSTTTPGYPYEAFSAKFSITGMTGQFNSTVQQVMSMTGALTPTGSSSSSGVPTSSGTGISTTTSKPSTGTSTSSATHSGTSTSKSGAAVRLVAGPGSSIAIAGSLLIVAFSGFFTAV